MNKQACIELFEANNIEYIHCVGVYVGKESDIQKHVGFSEELWLHALDTTQPKKITNEDYFQGVMLGENKEILAEWYLDGKEQYFEVPLKSA